MRRRAATARGWSCRSTAIPARRRTTTARRELLSLEPGQKLSGTARWQDAGRIRESEITTFTSKGVFALLYDQDALEITDGAKGSLRFLPQRASRAFQEKIRDIWGESDATGFLLAELTGERSGISETDSQIVSEVGLSHLVRRLGAALRVSREPAGDADSGAPAGGRARR